MKDQDALKEMEAAFDSGAELSSINNGAVVKIALEKDLLRHIIIKYGSVGAFEKIVDALYNLKTEKKPS